MVAVRDEPEAIATAKFNRAIRIPSPDIFSFETVRHSFLDLSNRERLEEMLHVQKNDLTRTAFREVAELLGSTRFDPHNPFNPPQGAPARSTSY